MYELDEKKYFYLLIIIPILLLIFLYNQYWKRKKQREFGDLELLKRLSPDKSVFKNWIKFVIILLAFVALIVALVNPKIGTKTETVNREGIDIVFAVDVSKSMLAEDIAPSRLEKTKQIISQIINNLAGDRVGIVAYAASAFPVLPITTDYGAAKLFLQGMNTDIVSSQGTSLSDAISLSTSFFTDDKSRSKLIVLLSDGEDHDLDVEEALKDAKKRNLKIITVGLGTERGGPIPVKVGGSAISLKRDNNNDVVITKLEADNLRMIANKTGGGYIDGSNTKNVVDYVKNALDNIEKKEFETQQFTDYNSQFQWFLGVALFLLLLDIFLLQRKTKWVKKLNLFNDKQE